MTRALSVALLLGLAGCKPDEPMTTETGTGGSSSSSTTSTSTTSTTSTDTSSTGEGSSTSGTSGSSTGEGSSSTGEPPCEPIPLVGDTPAPTLVSCPNVKAQSVWCLFLTDVAVMAVGLEDGVACQEKTLQDQLGFTPTASIAVLDEETLLVCDETGGFTGTLTKISVATGAVEPLPVDCAAVTHAAGHLLVYDSMLGGKVRVFEDLEAVLADEPIHTIAEDPPQTRNIAGRADTLFTAWHSDDHVGRFGVPCGEDLGDLPLENYSEWIGGLSVTDDDVLVTLKVLGQEQLFTFNASTGKAISTVPLSFDGFVQPRGLACFTGSP